MSPMDTYNLVDFKVSWADGD